MTHALSTSAGSSPKRASSRARPKLRKFRVLCAVTRYEWYEIVNGGVISGQQGGVKAGHFL